MRQTTAPRTTAVLLISLGFVAGVVFVVGCGGSGAIAAGGSTTVVHTKTLPSPVTWMDDFSFLATFTPSDPNTVVLAVEVIGEIETGATVVDVNAFSRRQSQGQPLGIPIQATELAVAPISIFAPYALSAGVFAGPTFQVQVFMDATTDGIPVTVNSLTIRLITTEGVMVMEDSPNVS